MSLVCVGVSGPGCKLQYYWGRLFWVWSSGAGGWGRKEYKMFAASKDFLKVLFQTKSWQIQILVKPINTKVYNSRHNKGAVNASVTAQNALLCRWSQAGAHTGAGQQWGLITHTCHTPPPHHRALLPGGLCPVSLQLHLSVWCVTVACNQAGTSLQLALCGHVEHWASQSCSSRGESSPRISCSLNMQELNLIYFSNWHLLWVYSPVIVTRLYTGDACYTVYTCSGLGAGGVDPDPDNQHSVCSNKTLPPLLALQSLPLQHQRHLCYQRWLHSSSASAVLSWLLSLRLRWRTQPQLRFIKMCQSCHGILVRAADGWGLGLGHKYPCRGRRGWHNTGHDSISL